MSLNIKENLCPYTSVVLFYHNETWRETPFFFYKTEDLLKLSNVDENVSRSMSTKKLTNEIRLQTFEAVDTTGTWTASVFAKVENGT
jgi:hypothetical protein